MHIAFLLPEYPHPKVNTHCGGIGTATKNVVLELIKHNKVTVFLYGQESSETISEENITIYKLAKNNHKYLGWYLYRKEINKFINQIVDKEKIDILEAPDWTGITAFMSFKIPLILRLHGSDAYFCYLSNKKQKIKNYIFEKLAYKNATAIISVSEYTLQLTEKIFQIKKTAVVIPNGLHLANFLIDDKIKTETETNTVLYFGSLARKKGVLELAEIFNELVIINPLAKLIIVGRDVVDNIENTSTLQLIESKLTKTAKQNFKYLGVVLYSEMKEIIVKASVCVFPSLAESFGMVTIEAMALAKGIVNTNYPWAKEIMIDGETGLLEDPKDHKAFAKKLNHLLKNTELRTAFGINARKHIETHFSMEKLIQDNINFYNKIIKNDF